jgi:hypothetical protein
VRPFFQIALKKAAIPLEFLYGLVSSNPHDSQVIDASPVYVGHRRMSKVVKTEPVDLSQATSRIEGGRGEVIFRSPRR